MTLPRAIAAGESAAGSLQELLALAESLMDSKSFDKADALLAPALAAHPNHADLVGTVGLLRMRQGRHGLASEHFMKALELTQGRSEKWRSLVRAAMFWKSLGEAREARRAKKLERAKELVQTAISFDSKVADAYAVLAGIQEDLNQHVQASASYRKALSINPLNQEALDGLVGLSFRMGPQQVQALLAQLSVAQRKLAGPALSRVTAKAVPDAKLAEFQELIARAAALIENEDFAAAEELIANGLKKYPDNADMAGEAGLLQLKLDRPDLAYGLFIRALELTKGNNGKWRSLVDVANYWKLMRDARDARQRGRLDGAEDMLNAAIRLDPKVADAHALLGAVLADNGKTSAATAAYRQALSISPLNMEALDGLIALNRRQGMTQGQRFIAQLSPEQRNAVRETVKRLEIESVEAEAGDPDDFLPALARMPAQVRPTGISRLWGLSLENAVATHLTAGRASAARALLKEAQVLAENDEEASLAVAAAWARLGDYPQAERVFENLRVAQTQPSVRWRLRHAEYSVLRSSPQAHAELKALDEGPALSPEDRRTLYELQLTLALRTANAHIDSGALASARATLDPFFKTSPDRLPVKHAEARLLAAEKLWPMALAKYAEILQSYPGDTEALRGQIDASIASGDLKASHALARNWADTAPPESAYAGMSLARLFLQLGDPAAARDVLDDLLERNPQDPQGSEVLLFLAQIARGQGRLDEEIDYLKKSILAERSTVTAQALADTSDRSAHERKSWKVKRLETLTDNRTQWLSASVEQRTRIGTAGLSQLDSTEIPLEYKLPWRSDDQLIFRTDSVTLNAGRLEPASAGFGSMLFCRSNCAPGLLGQSAHGNSLALGYARGNFRVDIGSTPLNFPVSNVVGGVRQSGNVGNFNYSLEASRRPVTDSLLSFAGTRDPNTGQAWGGVVATGTKIGFGLDSGGTLGFWSTLGVHDLTGHQVASSRRTQLMAGEQWRIVKEENRQFVVGLTGMYSGFSQNAGEYTWGHGGYFSPSRYRSISVPITYARRYPTFSYAIQGSVSAFDAETDGAVFFPTDNEMQTRAIAAAASTGVSPVYSKSSSQGTGYSLTAAWEYQIQPQLFFGAVLSVERSVNYAPNRAALYLRYALDRPAAQPVSMMPEPIAPFSRY